MSNHKQSNQSKQLPQTKTPQLYHHNNQPNKTNKQTSSQSKETQINHKQPNQAKSQS